MAKGIELATAYVSVAISSDDIAKHVAADFSDVQRRVAPKAGKNIGKAMAKGFETEAPDLSRLEREFEDAQKRIVQAESRATTEQENLARKVEIAQQKKAEAVEKYGEESSQALTAIDRLIIAEQKLESATMKADDEQRRLNKSLDEADAALKRAKDGTDDLEASAKDSGETADRAGRDWAGFGDAIGKALSGDFSGAFDSLKSAASGSADDVVDEFDGAGDTAAGSGGFGGSFVGGIAKFLGPAIAAAGIGKIVSDAVFAGMDGEKNADRMQASLGLSEEDAQEYRGIVASIYSEGWGDSKAEVQEGIEAFLSWSPELKANEDALEDVTSKAMALAEAFKIDIPMAAQLASQMVQNDLVGDTGEALDLMAAGFQQVPTTLRDEYVDALEEYTPHLANLGYTGEQAFGLLASSAELGQYGVDKAGDAMKELGIRASEMDGTTAEAYESLGLNAEHMASKIALGGEDAQEAIGDITTALLGVEDPATQAQLAVDLFGTPLEDLGKQNIPEFLTGLDTAGDSLGTFDGKAQEVSETLSGNASTSVDKFKRGFENLRAEAGSKLLTALENTTVWVNENLGPTFSWLKTYAIDPVTGAFSGMWQTLEVEVFPALQELWRVLVEDLGPSFTMFKDIAVFAWDQIWWTISTIWDLLAGLFTTIIQFLSGDFSGAWQTLKNTISGYWDNIWGKISSIWNDYIFPFLGGVGGWFERNLLSPIKSVIDRIADAWNGLKSAFSTPINWIIDYVINGAVRPVVNTVSSALGLDWQMGKVSRISARSRASGPNRGGTLTSDRAYAKGGYASPGWALVGEEGPELIDLRTPGRVYTADQTADALSLLPDRPYTADELGIASQALVTQDPGALRAAAGDSPSSALLPMGEPSVWDRIGGAWSDIWRGTWSTVTDVAGKAVEFVRGALGDAAALALNPVKGAIREHVGMPFLRDGFVNRLDSIINWVKGVDEGEGSVGGVPVREAMEPILEGLEPVSTSSDPGLLAGLLDGVTGSGSAHPMPGFPLTSRFGPRWGGHHAGVDWAAPLGSNVRAWRPGVVLAAGWNALLGRTGIGTVLAHAAGFGSYYGHLSRTLVRAGDTVSAGQTIAQSGNTGNSTGPHLHFEISRGGPHNVVNPLSYLYDSGGWAPPGTTQVVNKTRQPEAVLDPAESRAFIELATIASGSSVASMPPVFTLEVEGQRFTAWVKKKAGELPAVQAADEFVSSAARSRKVRA